MQSRTETGRGSDRWTWRRSGRKPVNNAITLDRTDADLLLDLQKDGINIYFQTTPDYPSETLDKAVAKL